MASPPAGTENRNDTHLLIAVADGDRAAFREFYGRYSGPMLSFAHRLLGEAGAAEEAVQDTFVKLWTHAGDYDDRKSSPFTWSINILRRTCIDQLRRRHRNSATVPLPDEDAMPAEFTVPENSRQAVDAHASSDRLQACLDGLTHAQRTTLELALFSPLTQAEIAARLNQPLGTIKTWIRRGLVELRSAAIEPPP